MSRQGTHPMAIVAREGIIANNKSSSKLSWKRKQALQIAGSIREYFEERGFLLPPAYKNLFGKGFKMPDHAKIQHGQNVVREIEELFPQGEMEVGVKAAIVQQEARDLKKQYNAARDLRAMRFFTDRETGECFYDDYVELAKAYYTLRNNSPAVYALFKHKTNNHYLKQLVASCCSRHRLDPVWNYRKSKLIRGLWYRFLQNSRIHEIHQPMHLMLTVPHKAGEWKGKEFYAREFIEKFNLMRKDPEWNRFIYGGEYGIEVTRSGKDGLHIHLHSLVFQRKHFSRDEVNNFIRETWNKLTGGAEVTWYETLYIYRKDEAGKFIMEASDGGIPVLDKSGKYTDDVYDYSIETEGVRGKKKKFYLDDREVWFMELTEDEKLKYYCDGVMECIKYHFKTDCFKAKDGSWDVELMKDVLKHSRNLRMYSKFGAFYREKSLNYSRLEKLDKPTLQDETQLAAEGINPDSDGVEGRILNPYTAKPAEAGDYSVVLALPEEQPHAKDKNGNVRAPVSNQVHDIFFKIRHGTSIREVISAIMVSQYERILIQADLERLQKFGWRAPRGEVLC